MCRCRVSRPQGRMWRSWANNSTRVCNNNKPGRRASVQSADDSSASVSVRVQQLHIYGALRLFWRCTRSKCSPQMILLNPMEIIRVFEILRGVFVSFTVPVPGFKGPGFDSRGGSYWFRYLVKRLNSDPRGSSYLYKWHSRRQEKKEIFWKP